MKCPHCAKDIPDAEMARHLASKGGSKSRRVITDDQQKLMQSRRKKPPTQPAN